MNKFLRALIFTTPIAGIGSYMVVANFVEASDPGGSDGKNYATNATQGQDDDAKSDSFDLRSIFPDPESFSDEDFPRDLHYLLPPPVPLLSDPDRNIKYEHVAYGAVDPKEELEQPIAYSHMLHAGELKIECQYCHTYARRSIHAGIPSTQICMNCHGKNEQGQPKVSVEGRDELLKLLTFYYGRDEVTNMVGEEKAKTIPQTVEIASGTVAIEQGEIPWVKVHDTPDFVYFPHKRHVKSGILCQECHGEVQDDMTVGRRVSELTMGWCLNCHESHPSIQTNYCGVDATESCEEAELRRAEIKDCWNCHK